MNISQPILAGAVGLCIGGVLSGLLFFSNGKQHDFHPIADPTDDEYHVHADFKIYLGDTPLDLSKEQYMTSGTQTKHQHAHLHDGNGEVKHIHAQGISFAEFLASLDITLTDSCLTVPGQAARCSGETEEVLLYVNDELFTKPISTYVPVDNDRILLFFGNSQDPNVTTYKESVPADACYYSGTCPERGIAPPENCGLTCEL